MTRAVAAFSFLCVVFGTTFGAIAVGIHDGWPPLLSAGLRFAIAGVLVLAVAAARRELRPLTRRDVTGIAMIGMCVTAIVFGTLYIAESVLPSSLAALLSASSPLFAFALAIRGGTRRLDRSGVIGIALGSAGVALVVGFAGAGTGLIPALAALALVLSELSYAAGLTATRALMARLPTLQVAGGQQAIGGFTLLALSLAFEHRGPVRIDTTGIAALVYLTLVASAGAHSISIWLAGTTSATFASSWTYVSPFIALIAGALWLHEPIGVSVWIGGVLVVCGCVALNADLLRSMRGRSRRVAGAPG